MVWHSATIGGGLGKGGGGIECVSVKGVEVVPDTPQST
jgi:hypothetical protein